MVGTAMDYARFLQALLDDETGEYLSAKFTLSMVDEGWVSGTFDPETATFTPEA